MDREVDVGPVHETTVTCTIDGVCTANVVH